MGGSTHEMKMALGWKNKGQFADRNRIAAVRPGPTRSGAGVLEITTSAATGLRQLEIACYRLAVHCRVDRKLHVALQIFRFVTSVRLSFGNCLLVNTYTRSRTEFDS